MRRKIHLGASPGWPTASNKGFCANLFIRKRSQNCRREGARIIGQLALEANARPQCAAMLGVRALLLYPMNALVNDQLSRIRRLFGSAHASELISGIRSSNQALGHQQEGREDQGVDDGDRDHASGKATVIVTKARPRTSSNRVETQKDCRTSSAWSPCRPRGQDRMIRSK